MFWTKKCRIIVIVDYENIVLGPDFKKINFQKLREKILEIGSIDFAFVFIPPHCSDSLLREKINNEGFDIIICSKQSKEVVDIIEDTVDIEMIRFSFKFSQYDEITDIIIISDDKHMREAEREIKNKGKKVHRWGKKDIFSCLEDII